MRHAKQNRRRPDKDDWLLMIGEGIVIGSVIFAGVVTLIIGTIIFGG
nr:MAG TPA: Na, K-ATPase alpha subunit,Na+,K+-ATPase beta PROTEIN, ION PUMP, ATPASE [Caudoviricetes sp.]